MWSCRSAVTQQERRTGGGAGWSDLWGAFRRPVEPGLEQGIMLLNEHLLFL